MDIVFIIIIIIEFTPVRSLPIHNLAIGLGRPGRESAGSVGRYWRQLPS